MATDESKKGKKKGHGLPTGAPPAGLDEPTAGLSTSTTELEIIHILQHLVSSLESSSRLPDDLVGKLKGTPLEATCTSLQAISWRLFRAESSVQGLYRSDANAPPLPLPEELSALPHQQEALQRGIKEISQGVNDLADVTRKEFDANEKCSKDLAKIASEEARKFASVAKSDMESLETTVTSGLETIHIALARLQQQHDDASVEQVTGLQTEITTLQLENAALQSDLNLARRDMRSLNGTLGAIADGHFHRLLLDDSSDENEAEVDRDADLPRRIHENMSRVALQSQIILDAVGDWPIAETERMSTRVNQWTLIVKRIKGMDSRFQQATTERARLIAQHKSMHYAAQQLLESVPVEKWTKNVPAREDQSPSGEWLEIVTCLVKISHDMQKLKKKNAKLKSTCCAHALFPGESR